MRMLWEEQTPTDILVAMQRPSQRSGRQCCCCFWPGHASLCTARRCLMSWKPWPQPSLGRAGPRAAGSPRPLWLAKSASEAPPALVTVHVYGSIGTGMQPKRMSMHREDLCLKLGLYKASQVYKWLDLNH